MTKKLLPVAALACILASCSTKPTVPPAIPYDAEIEQKVEALLQKMTLEEKVGQMTEIIAEKLGHHDPEKGFVLDEAMLDTIFGKYKVGSILTPPRNEAQTLEKYQEIIGKIQEVSMREIGIPCIYGLDQNHGTTYTQGGTLFPQNINVAATFNTDIAYECAKATAYETRAGSCPWTYSPTIDLGRDPRWPRQWENYGEDCYVNAQMGRAAVLGFQGDDPNHIGMENIAVSLKHYMGYGVPVSGKDRTPSSITESDMREKHFAPFLECVRAGALTIMVNSGSNNGLPFHANHKLLTTWLKEELNWDGMIVTDWADINNLWTREKVAANKKEAIKMAINAGIDMAMEPYQCDFCTLLIELVNEGEVPMSRIDDATRRVLRLKYRLGLFDNPTCNLADYPKFGGKEFAELATKGAEESMVLLKNNNDILPLAVGKRILLTGPNANSMRCLNGGWSYTWQGQNADKFASQYNTILEAMQNKFGAANVKYEAGVTYNNAGSYWEENEPEIGKAVAAAKGCDYIVACIGENSYCETPGNLTDLNLSANQLNLVKELSKTGKPIILVLNEGRPRLLSSIEPLATAVVHIMLPGNYGADALANLLAGDANFSGRLPFTYPKEINSITTYDHRMSEQVETMAGAYNYEAVVSAQWAFGYGKSYTTFEYSNLVADKTTFGADDEITFSVDVTNTGSRAGKESVLLFSRDHVASLTPEIRRLRAFTKIELAPGETQTVKLTIKGEDLAFVNADGKWTLEKGGFTMQAGSQTIDIECNATKLWDTPNR